MQWIGISHGSLAADTDNQFVSASQALELQFSKLTHCPLNGRPVRDLLNAQIRVVRSTRTIQIALVPFPFRFQFPSHVVSVGFIIYFRHYS